MVYTLDEKIAFINEQIRQCEAKNPITIVESLMDQEIINIHGPEHHYLDGAAFLVAYHNAGGAIDVNEALQQLQLRAMKMPGAMCGQWGVCGSVASIGACLAIIHNTGPLSDNEFYKDNMEFTSRVLAVMSTIGGPRCCKRNAFLSILNGIDFVEKKYGIVMEKPILHKCKYSTKNTQCIKEICPFYKL